MIDRFFVDTNVLLYRFGDTDPAKRELADDWFAALWRENAGRLSWQVIFEFYSNAIPEDRRSARGGPRRCE